MTSVLGTIGGRQWQGQLLPTDVFSESLEHGVSRARIFLLTSCFGGAMLVISAATPPSSAAPARTPGATPPAGQSTTFQEFLSELNPLQYLPVIGTIYRSVTGDTISETARAIGSFVVSGLVGGPIGLATNAALLGIEHLTGIDPEKVGQDMLASLGVAAKREPEDGPDTLASSVVAWSPGQLADYGVTVSPNGTLAHGTVVGADVLNDMELVRLGRVSLA